MTTTPDPAGPASESPASEGPASEGPAAVPVTLGRILLGLLFIVIGVGLIVGLAWVVWTGWDDEGVLFTLAEIGAEWGIWIGGAGVVLVFVGVVIIARSRRRQSGIVVFGRPLD